MPVWLIRYLPHLICVAAVVACLAFAGYRIHSHGEAAGRAEIQARWDVEREEIARQRALQEAEARAKEEADRQAAKEVQDALQEKLDSADARARDLARRLSDFQARDRARRLSEAAGATASLDDAPSESRRDGEVRQALEDVMSSCSKDSALLAGWQAWWARVSD